MTPPVPGKLVDLHRMTLSILGKHLPRPPGGYPWAGTQVRRIRVGYCANSKGGGGAGAVEGPHTPTHENHAGPGDHLHDVRVGFQAPPGFYHRGKLLDVPVRPRNRNCHYEKSLGALG